MRSLSFITFRRHPLDFLLELREQRGDVAQIRFGRSNFVLVSDLDAVHYVLARGARHFERQPLFIKRRFHNPRPRDVQYFPRNREEQLELRRIMNPAFHRNTIAASWQDGVKAAEASFGTLGNEIVLQDVVQKHGLRLALERLLLAGNEHSTPELEQANENWLRFDRPVTSTLLEFWDQVNLVSLLRMGGGLHHILSLNSQLIDERAARPEADDVISLILREGRFTRLALLHFSRVLFTAFSDSFTQALNWTLLSLAQHSEWASLIREEAHSALTADTPPSPVEAPVTHATICEALRLYPPTWRIGRINTAPVELAGQHVPENSFCWVSPWVIHRHEKLWPQPDVFRPQRWLDREPRERLAFIPFGSGGMKCPGSDQAMQELVASVLQFVALYDTELLNTTPITPTVKSSLTPAQPVRLNLVRQQ